MGAIHIVNMSITGMVCSDFASLPLRAFAGDDRANNSRGGNEIAYSKKGTPETAQFARRNRHPFLDMWL